MAIALTDLLDNAKTAQELREILKHRVRQLSGQDVREIHDKLELAHRQGSELLSEPSLSEPDLGRAHQALEHIAQVLADAGKVLERKERWENGVAGNVKLIQKHGGEAAALHRTLREKRRELRARDVLGMRDTLARLESEALAAWRIVQEFSRDEELEHRLARATEAIRAALQDAERTVATKKPWEDAVAANVAAVEAELHRLEAALGLASAAGDARETAPSAPAGGAGSAATGAATARAVAAARGEAAGADPVAAATARGEAAGADPEAADPHGDDADVDAAEFFGSELNEADTDHEDASAADPDADVDHGEAFAADLDAADVGAADSAVGGVVGGAHAPAAAGGAATTDPADAGTRRAAATPPPMAPARAAAGGDATGRAQGGSPPGPPEVGRIIKRIEDMLKNRRPIDRPELDRLNGKLQQLRTQARALVQPPKAAPEAAPAKPAVRFTHEEMRKAKADVVNALEQAEAAMGIQWPPPPKRPQPAAPAPAASQPAAAPATTGGVRTGPGSAAESTLALESATDTTPEPVSEVASAADTTPEPVSEVASAADTTPEPVSEVASASASESALGVASDGVPEPVSEVAPASASEVAADSSAASDTTADSAAQSAPPLTLGAIKVIQGLMQRAREVLESGAVPGSDRKKLWSRYRAVGEALRAKRDEAREAELGALREQVRQVTAKAAMANPAKTRKAIQEIQHAVVQSPLSRAERDTLLAELRKAWNTVAEHQSSLRDERKRREEEGLHKLGEHFQRWEDRQEGIAGKISRLEALLVDLKERQRTSTSIGYRVVAEKRMVEIKAQIGELKEVLEGLTQKIADVKPRLEAAGWEPPPPGAASGDGASGDGGSGDGTGGGAIAGVRQSGPGSKSGPPPKAGPGPKPGQGPKSGHRPDRHARGDRDQHDQSAGPPEATDEPADTVQTD